MDARTKAMSAQCHGRWRRAVVGVARERDGAGGQARAHVRRLNNSILEDEAVWLQGRGDGQHSAGRAGRVGAPHLMLASTLTSVPRMTMSFWNSTSTDEPSSDSKYTARVRYWASGLTAPLLRRRWRPIQVTRDPAAGRH